MTLIAETTVHSDGRLMSQPLADDHASIRPAYCEDRELSTLLREAFAQRVARNPRYSVRAFARWLGIHHSTLARVMARTRGLSAGRIESLAQELQLSQEDIRAVIEAEYARKVLAATRTSRFRPDSRWIATATGIDVDHVNRALHLLLYTRRLRFAGRDAWVSVDP